MRRALGCVALGVVLVAPRAAAAPTDVHECVTAAERGQRLRDKLLLKPAQGEFISCARDVCPGPVKSECTKWLADVSDRIPSIVVRATDGAGHDVTDVRVFVDDAPAQERVDGRRLEIDPGPHRIRFERSSFPPKTIEIVAREGEKNRFVDVAIGAEAPPPPPPPPPKRPHDRPFPVLGAVLAGVAVLGGASFAFFAATGQSDVDHLRATCAPRCAPSDVSSARTKIIVANVSLGVGIVAAVSAGYFLFVAPAPSADSAGLSVGGTF
jgi:hypothetical protein